MFNFGKELKSVTIKIEGMMCTHCQKRVEDAIKSVKGVKDVTVDLTNGTATFKLPCDMDVLLVKQAIEKEDYTVTL